MHSFEVAANCLGNERPRAVEPCRNPGWPPAFDVAAKAGRDFDARGDLTAFEPPLEIGIIGKRGLFDKIARPPQLFEISPAFVAVIAVEDGEGQV